MSLDKTDILKTITVCGEQIDVVGYYNDSTEPGEYEFYDLFIGSECINAGEPLYTVATLEQDAKWFLARYGYENE